MKFSRPSLRVVVLKKFIFIIKKSYCNKIAQGKTSLSCRKGFFMSALNYSFDADFAFITEDGPIQLFELKKTKF